MEKICNFITSLYLYADMTKFIHYSTNSNHKHELADDLRDKILEFSDDFAEQMFGILHKPRFSEFTLDLSLKYSEKIGGICKILLKLVGEVQEELKDDDKFTSILSLIDDFKGELNKIVFLDTLGDLNKN